MIRRGAVLLLGVVATVFSAESTDAPLAESKAQLQSLKRDSVAGQAATQPNGLQIDLPTVQPSAAAPDLPLAPKDQQTGRSKERSAHRQDWLLDGVRALESNPSADGKNRRAGRSREEEPPLDPNDPDYFLRVYERQRTHRREGQADVSSPESPSPNSGAVDPLAPFMKEWLANSPVRAAIEDARHYASARTDALPTQPAVERQSDSLAVREVQSIAEGARLSDPLARTNPFVEALGLPSPGQQSATTLEGRSATTASPPNASVVPNTNFVQAERPKIDLKQALPPLPAEDKKYFPQLKKF